MRKLILPLVIGLFLCTGSAFSQRSCWSALQIPLDKSCSYYATSDSTTPTPGGNSLSCGFTANRRVSWYKFIPTAANQCISINVTNLGVQTEVTLYSGCAPTNNSTTNRVANTTVCFSDGKGVWSAGTTAGVTYNVGQTYYLRVYTNQPTDGTTQLINLCGTSNPVAANDLCKNAIRFDAGTIPSNNACSHFTGTATSSGTSPNDEGINNNNARFLCAYGLQNTVWYSFKVAGTGIDATITLSGINCDGYGTGGSQILQAGLLKGSCNAAGNVTGNGTLTPVDGVFQPSNPAAYPTTGGSCAATTATTLTLHTGTSVVAGQTVYLGLDGYSGANCQFNINASQNFIPIPIRLKYFTAWKNPSDNLIRWSTAWEHNNEYFEIERSLDAMNFESIGRV
ncbi:MAG: hypothetical protein ABUT20_22710, partial [Bacteroidota bacterium]